MLELIHGYFLEGFNYSDIYEDPQEDYQKIPGMPSRESGHSIPTLSSIAEKMHRKRVQN